MSNSASRLGGRLRARAAGSGKQVGSSTTISACGGGGLVQKLVKALAAQALREVDWLAEELPKAALGEDATPAGESGCRESVRGTVAELPMKTSR